jgi:hypothetical protein
MSFLITFEQIGEPESITRLNLLSSHFTVFTQMKSKYFISKSKVLLELFASFLSSLE